MWQLYLVIANDQQARDRRAAESQRRTRRRPAATPAPASTTRTSRPATVRSSAG